MSMDLLWTIAQGPTPAVPVSATPFVFHTEDGIWDDFVGAVQFWGYALVSGSGDGGVRMWDMRTGQAHRTLLGHSAPISCLQFDEMHIVSGSLDKTVRVCALSTAVSRAHLMAQIWDVRTGGVIETIRYEHPVSSLQFDTRKVVTCAGENYSDVRHAGPILRLTDPTHRFITERLKRIRR